MGKRNPDIAEITQKKSRRKLKKKKSMRENTEFIGKEIITLKRHERNLRKVEY